MHPDVSRAPIWVGVVGLENPPAWRMKKRQASPLVTWQMSRRTLCHPSIQGRVNDARHVIDALTVYWCTMREAVSTERV